MYKTRIINLIILTLFMSAIYPVQALAHPGRLDKQGCHTNRKTGEYHCHRKTSVKKRSKKATRIYARKQSRRFFEDKDCKDFISQWEAQEFFEKHGGPAFDPHGLDRDKDGIACENNPKHMYLSN